MLVTLPSSTTQIPSHLDSTTSHLQNMVQKVCQATSFCFSKKTCIAAIITISLMVFYTLYARGKCHKKDQPLPDLAKLGPNKPKTPNAKDKSFKEENLSPIPKNVLGSPLEASTPNTDPISSKRLFELDQHAPNVRRRHTRTLSEGGTNSLTGSAAGRPPVAPPPSSAETPEPSNKKARRMSSDGIVAQKVAFHETAIIKASPAASQRRARSASVGDGSFLKKPLEKNN